MTKSELIEAIEAAPDNALIYILQEGAWRPVADIVIIQEEQVYHCTLESGKRLPASVEIRIRTQT